MLRRQRDAFMIEQATPLMRWVLIIGLVHHAAIILLLSDAGVPRGRVCALVALFFFFAFVQRQVKNYVVRSRRIERGYLMLNVVGQFFMVGQMALTGGLHSPYLAGLAVTVSLPVLLFGPHPIGRKLAMSLAVMIALLALAPSSVTGPAITSWHYQAISILVLSWAMIMIRTLVSKLYSAACMADEAIDGLREERVSEAEAQTRRLQAVGSRVAHELKNPLASVKGLVQLVARGAADDKTKQRLDVVQSEIARMEGILREYLSFSRPLEDLRPQTVDLAEVVRDAAGVVSGRAETGRIAVELKLRGAKIEADPRRLKEALLNVLANAIDATPSGGRIEVETRPADGGGGQIVVADTGRGIRPEDLERLGTSFFTTRADGTGLGVVLAQGVVRQHGGEIVYTSEPGRGTVVTISLPARPTGRAPTCQELCA